MVSLRELVQCQSTLFTAATKVEEASTFLSLEVVITLLALPHKRNCHIIKIFNINNPICYSKILPHSLPITVSASRV